MIHCTCEGPGFRYTGSGSTRNMTVIVKTPGLHIPTAIAKKAGINPGDSVEFVARRGMITITSTQPD